MFRQLGKELLWQFIVLMVVWGLFLLFGLLLNAMGPIIQPPEGGRTGSMRGMIDILLGMTAVLVVFCGLCGSLGAVIDIDLMERKMPRMYRAAEGTIHLIVGFILVLSSVIFHIHYIHR